MFVAIKLFIDASLILMSYLAAYDIKFRQSLSGLMNFPWNQYGWYLFGIIGVYLICLNFYGMYKERKGILIEIDEFLGGIFSVVSAWALIIVLTFIKGEYIYSRPVIIMSLPVSLIAITVMRQIILRIEMFARAKGYAGKKAVIIGSGKYAESVANKIKNHPSYGVFFVGFVGGEGPDNLGDLDDLEKIIDDNRIKAVYVADPELTRDNLARLANICDNKNISLGTMPDIFQILTTSPTVEDIEGIPVVNLKKIKLTPLNRLVKRWFDIFVALFGLAVFLIPMGIIAVMIKITSPGPVIYVQRRVGKGGKFFRLYKFRTMVHKAEKGMGAVLATEDDPRKTSFGKFLRSTNLDELPQLFNIIKGDMSFVGPRPERPKFVSRFKDDIPNYMERHSVKAGLAGWAQMQDGGYDMPAEEKLKYDLFYMENWSLLLDIKIILKCAEIAFTRKRIN